MADEKLNTGYINISYNAEENTWSVGGNYRDAKGNEWDLGFSKTTWPGVAQAIALVAAGLPPALAGKGVRRQDRRNGNNGGRR